MPKVVREDIDNLNAVLTVTVDKESYEPKFLEELKKFRDKASVKGFRKGKTPISFLKKMYGKAVLGEIVHEMLQEAMGEHFKGDEDTNYLGQPIPNENSPKFDIDVRDLQDYEFKFDVGIAPEFEVQGLESVKSFEQYKVEVPDERVDEEIDRIRKQTGKRTEPEDDIQEDDLIKMEIKELDDDAVKAEGWESEFSILVNRIASEDLKKEILTKKKGDTLTVNPFDLEEAEDEHIKKYILNMSPEDMDREIGDAFQATILSVSRTEPGDLDQELFDKYFGPGKVNSEEEFRDEIRKDIGSYYEGESDGVLFRSIRKDLIETNRAQLNLPNEFLKRWLVASNEKNTEEIIERDYDRFSDQLRWSMISNKLAEKFELKIEEEDLRAHFSKQIMGYMGGYLAGNQEMMDNMINRLMQDREQLTKATEQLADEQIFGKLKENFAIMENSVSAEEFGKVLEQIREEDAPPAPVAEDEEE